MSAGPQSASEYAAAMAGLRQLIEQRAADKKEQERAKVSDRDLAQYDTLALGRLLRPLLDGDGRGWRAVAIEIGVTTPDLSRIAAGQTVSAAKIFAVCDWAGIDARRFYRGPRRKKRFTGKALKQGDQG